MSYDSVKFFGASVRSINAAIGYNEQKSQLSVSLVQDTVGGDLFVAPTIGEPAIFQIGLFTFTGIVQKYGVSYRQDGYPTYQVIVEDPRDILAGTQVILNGYSGATSAIPNLINVYGYWENLSGFGGSQVNETGMLWSLIKPGLQNIINSVSNNYGGALQYRGYSYQIDLSSLPLAPDDYRIGGNNASLLDIISLLCADASHDFIVVMNGNVIKPITIPRITQPPLGTISTLLTTYSGLVVSSETGAEARNEPTSNFVVGGPINTLHLMDDTGISPFFGFSNLGDPILPYLANLGDGYGQQYVADLNAFEISDILGTDVYTCSFMEMLLALQDYVSWSSYLTSKRPALAATIQLICLHRQVNNPAVMFEDALENDGNQIIKATEAMIGSAAGFDADQRSRRVYDFIRKIASEYYGKKFVVQIPFVYYKVDPNTLEITHSWEVSDGGFLESGAEPLGLDGFNESVFQTQDGRYTSFVRFDNVIGTNLSAVNPSDTVITEDGTLFMRCNVSPTIISVLGYPAVVITLNSQVYQMPAQFGLSDVVEGFIAGFRQVVKRNHANASMNIHPDVIAPNYAAIPLRSTTLTYGPWYLAGTPGKVNFIQDTSLVPWNYGSYTALDAAGFAKAITAASNMNISEAGSIELVGAPIASLGEALLANGPNISNISVQYSERGITTTYRFETFTKKYGVFARDTAEKLRKINQDNLSVKKTLRGAIREAIKNDTIQNQAYLGWNANRAPYLTRGKTPQPAALGLTVDDGEGGKRVGVGSLTYEEFMTSIGAGQDYYTSRAGGSWTNIIRPFSTDPNNDEMGAFESHDTTFNGANSTNYSPYTQGNDIEFYPWGDEFNDSVHNWRRGKQVNNETSARPICLRGPLVVTGWGFGIDGKYYPGDEQKDGGATYMEGWLRKSQYWPTGPVDLLWDTYRKVWTSHDMVYGITDETGIPAGGQGILVLYSDVDESTGVEFTVWNPYSTAIPGNTKAQALYSMHCAKFFISSVDCT